MKKFYKILLKSIIITKKFLQKKYYNTYFLINKKNLIKKIYNPIIQQKNEENIKLLSQLNKVKRKNINIDINIETIKGKNDILENKITTLQDLFINL